MSFNIGYKIGYIFLDTKLDTKSRLDTILDTNPILDTNLETSINPINSLFSWSWSKKMTKKERLQYKVQTRITERQKEQLDELDVSLRDIIDYYIVHNTNKTLELSNRQKRLMKEIKEMESQILDMKEELKEVNLQLGVPDDENIATIEVSTIAERIKSNCLKENGDKCDKLTLQNYLSCNKGKAVINHGLVEFGIKDNENRLKFIENVLKYLKCDDEVTFNFLKS